MCVVNTDHFDNLCWPADRVNLAWLSSIVSVCTVAVRVRLFFIIRKSYVRRHIARSIFNLFLREPIMFVVHTRTLPCSIYTL